LVAIALLGSALLAYASGKPNGNVGSSGGVTTTTTVKATTTTTIPKCKEDDRDDDDHKKEDGKNEGKNKDSVQSKKHDDENNECPENECKPGNGFGDKNHCHSGPPGQNKKDDGKEPNKKDDRKGKK